MTSIVESLTEYRNELRKLVMATDATREHAAQVDEIFAKTEALFQDLKARMKANTIGRDDARAAAAIYDELGELYYAMADRFRRILSPSAKA